MCEHAGMLNHLYAKIEDLDVRPRARWSPRPRPQCFDISLWQLVAALLVGGRTLLVEQEVILDVERFVDTVADDRVGVLQTRAVLPRRRARPTWSSTRATCRTCTASRPTGEALKKELAQRWFAAQPAITLVNAYGLTETSDDTNHEVMHRVPDGRPGPARRARPQRAASTSSTSTCSRCRSAAPAWIVFSGVCVGRGYVNDPERTRAVFMTDPHRRPATGSTGAATTAAGCPTASWSSSAAGTPRSRSGASGSRSARSRTPCCGYPVSATAPWWSPATPTGASTSWPSTPA